MSDTQVPYTKITILIDNGVSVNERTFYKTNHITVGVEPKYDDTDKTKKLLVQMEFEAIPDPETGKICSDVTKVMK